MEKQVDLQLDHQELRIPCCLGILMGTMEKASNVLCETKDSTFSLNNKTDWNHKENIFQEKEPE